MSERKVIFECRVGSWLYGTNTPASDEDFQGVFLPSVEDLLGLQACPKEWSCNKKTSTTVQNQAGDVDRKYYSLQRFLSLALEGQPGQMELLFAPKNTHVHRSREWEDILDHRSLFLSRKSIAPFIGFALSQAHKATIKGEHLRLIRRILEWQEGLTPAQRSGPLRNLFCETYVAEDGKAFAHFTKEIRLLRSTNEEGFTMVGIAGREFDEGRKFKDFVNSLKKLESKYGQRAQAAAEKTYDHESLMHAYRILGQGKEMLQTGKITLPYNPEHCAFLLSVKRGEMDHLDHFKLLTEQIDELRQVVEPNSPLPEEPYHSAVNDMCIEMLGSSLGIGASLPVTTLQD